MLRFFTPPPELRSAHDIIGSKTAQTMTSLGFPAQSVNLWPDWAAKLFENGKIPCGRTFFRKMVAPPAARRKMRRLQEGDIAWVLGFAAPYQPEPSLERMIKAKKGYYIFHVMDDWFSVDNLAAGTIARVHLSDLVVVPTEALARRIKSLVPKARVIRLEEPIDMRRFKCTSTRPRLGLPTLVWTGNPNNLANLEQVESSLSFAHQKVPFCLRIISSEKPRRLFRGFTWEWCKYDAAREFDLLNGAVAGLSPLQDTDYAHCKGCYKVKTYFAAGLPVIASPIGHQKEMITPGEDGYLASSKKEWSAAIVECLEKDAVELGRLKANARRKAEQYFDHAMVLPDWVRLLKNVFPNYKLN